METLTCYIECKLPKTAIGLLEAILDEVDTYMLETPEEMSWNSTVYAFNLSMLIIFTYLMGAYPDDHFYTFNAVLIPFMMGARTIKFYRDGHLFYYLDLCYFATYVVWLFIVVFPKSEWFYNMSLILSFGLISVSIIAFMNPLDLADDCVPIIYHLVPQLLLYNVKCVTMVNQKDLPVD